MGLCRESLFEGTVMRQTEDHECGLHVLVNTRLLLAQICSAVITPCISLTTPVTKQFMSHPPYMTSDIPTSKPRSNLQGEVQEGDANSLKQHKGSWNLVRACKKSKKVKTKQVGVNSDKMYFENENPFEVLSKETIFQCKKRNSIIKNSSGTWKKMDGKLNVNIENTVYPSRTVNGKNKLAINKYTSTKSTTNSTVFSAGCKVPPTTCPGLLQTPVVKKSVKFFSDSQGRGVSPILSNILSSDYSVLGHVVPNGTMQHVLEAAGRGIGGAGRFDCTVVMAGTNNVLQRSHNGIERDLKRFLDSASNSNVVVVGLPKRFDDINSNILVDLTNKSLKNMCDKFKNVQFISLADLGRNSSTKHGLHLNNYGKRKVAGLLAGRLSVNLNGSICVNVSSIPKATSPKRLIVADEFQKYPPPRGIGYPSRMSPTSSCVASSSRVFVSSSQPFLASLIRSRKRV